MTSIGEAAFSSCPLTAFYGKHASSDNKCLIIDGCLIMAVSGLTEYTIPDGITSIGDYAFYNCESLTSITIPDGITSIGDSAFGACSSLTSITIPDNITSIGIHAFDGCSSLTSVTIPDSVTEISNYAFTDCTSLTNVTLGISVTRIGHYAFENCTSLTSITIPDSVTSILSSPFSNCYKLSSFYGKFASSDHRCLIDDGCLREFAPYGLKEYTIPDNVTSIGWGAFMGRSSLTSITIPESVSSIGNYAFSGCESLTNIYCRATTPPIMDIVDGLNYIFPYSSAKIYVPTASVNTYKYSYRWSYYADYIVGFDFE